VRLDDIDDVILASSGFLVHVRLMDGEEGGGEREGKEGNPSIVTISLRGYYYMTSTALLGA
jgi:hypothetical protein